MGPHYLHDCLFIKRGEMSLRYVRCSHKHYKHSGTSTEALFKPGHPYLLCSRLHTIAVWQTDPAAAVFITTSNMIRMME